MSENRQPVILVVEDDDYCRDLLGQILEMNDYRVHLASNGLEALQMLESVVPDLILLDMKMPVMNGWEFSRRLKERKGERIPFVIVSAADDIQSRVEETGADGWLEKPFELPELLQAVESHLKTGVSV